MLEGKHKLSDRKGSKFIGYWRWSEKEAKDETLAALRKAYDDALDRAAKFTTHVEKLRNDVRLSDEGRRQEGKHAIELATPDLVRAKFTATAKLKNSLRAKLSAMTPVDIDRSDVLAEMQRREIRDVLRAMPSEQRDQLLERCRNNAVIDAVLAADAFATGVSESIVSALSEQRIAERYPERDELKEHLQAVENVEAAFDAALEEMRLDVGLLPHEFNAIVAPLADPITAHWQGKLETDEKAKPAGQTPAKKKQPLADPEAIAAAVNSLPFEERSRMIDLAIDRQASDLMGEKAA